MRNAPALCLLVACSCTHPPTVYVASPDTSTMLWRSTDGGRTFKSMAATDGGGGDSDVVVDAKGTLYVADLLDASNGFKFPVSTSYDGGQTYARIVNAAPEQTGLDRQWIASNGAGHVLGMARDDTGTLFAWVSNNSARTFDGPISVANNVTIQGPIVTGPGHCLRPAMVGAVRTRYNLPTPRVLGGPPMARGATAPTQPALASKAISIPA